MASTQEMQDAAQTMKTLQTNVHALRQQLNQFKLLVANNALLVYIATTVQMDDTKLQDFLNQVNTLSPPPGNDATINDLSREVLVAPGIQIFNFVVNMATFANETWFPAEVDAGLAISATTINGFSQDALDSGLVNMDEKATIEPLGWTGQDYTEAAVKSTTSASLSATGIGGAWSDAQVQPGSDKLEGRMQTVNAFTDAVKAKITTINSRTLVHITFFQNLAGSAITLLPTGQAPHFSADFPATAASLDKCLNYQHHACRQLVLLLQLREWYARELAHNPKVTKDFVIGRIGGFAPGWCTYDTLSQMWTEILVKYSASMAAAT